MNNFTNLLLFIGSLAIVLIALRLIELKAIKDSSEVRR